MTPGELKTALVVAAVLLATLYVNNKYLHLETKLT
jgi:hypothetical protein